jgi:hypothetical protein
MKLFDDLAPKRARRVPDVPRDVVEELHGFTRPVRGA